MKAIENFFYENNFCIEVDKIHDYVQLILDDMADGLSKKEDEVKLGQEMILTHKLPPKVNAKNTDVIVIDAGGTNFRSCLVRFDSKGLCSITEEEKTKMPGVENELSKNEFFEQIAQNIHRLKNKSQVIAFCFSYPMQILKNGDGKLICFAKEIKAPEVVGCCIGKELMEVLKNRGWENIKKIVLLNDTVAALNAAALADTQKKYHTYLGFILGTGMNVAYVENGSFDSNAKNIESQIIDCESGKCQALPLSNIDEEFHKLTNSPFLFKTEKMCAGGYLPSLILLGLKIAAKNNYLEDDYTQYFTNLDYTDFSMKNVNDFLQKEVKTFGKLTTNAAKIVDAFINRSALFSACVVAASVIRSVGLCSHNNKPVGILCNGTTFFKTFNLSVRFEQYLKLILTDKHGINFELISIDNDIVLGTAASVF